MFALGYLPKLKKQSGTIFCSHFLHDFFIKIFKKIKFLFRQFNFDCPLKQWSTGTKREKDGYAKVRIS